MADYAESIQMYGKFWEAVAIKQVMDVLGTIPKSAGNDLASDIIMEQDEHYCEIIDELAEFEGMSREEVKANIDAEAAALS